MIELNQKYVLHIPLYKYVNNRLILIEIDDILNELTSNLTNNGYDSFYTQKVISHYKKRSFEELIITIYAGKNNRIEEIFIEWFLKNNHILDQESLGFEKNDRLFIKNIK